MTTSWPDSNRRKAWKWVYQVLAETSTREGDEYWVVPTRGGAAEQRFCFFRPHAQWPAERARETWWHLVVKQQSAEFVLARERHAVDGFATRDVRSAKVVPELLARLDRHGVPARLRGQDRDKTRDRWRSWRSAQARSQYVETWHWLGLYAAGQGHLVHTLSPCFAPAADSPRVQHVKEQVDARRDPGLQMFQAGPLTFLASGLVVNQALEVLDLGPHVAHPPGDKEILARLTEHEASGGPAARGRGSLVAARLDSYAHQLLFPTGTSGELLFNRSGGWSRWAFAEPGAPVESLPVKGEIATFYSNDDGAWLVTAAGQALRWPPRPGRPETMPMRVDQGLYQPGKSGAWSRTLAGGRGVLARARGGHLELLEATGASWRDASFRRVDPSSNKFAAAHVLVAHEGRLVVVAEGGPVLHVFDRATRSYRVLPASCEQDGHPCWGDVHPTEPLAAHFSRFATLWDLEAGHAVAALDPRASSKLVGAFSPDGRHLAIVADGFLVVMTIATRTLRAVCRVASPHSDQDAGPIAFSPDGRHLALSHDEMLVLDWRRVAELLPRLPELVSARPPGPPRHVAAGAGHPRPGGATAVVRCGHAHARLRRRHAGGGA